MRIALVGASGRSGVRIAAEALSRGHRITGIARNPEKIETKPGLTAVKGDVNDPEGLVDVIRGHDAVILANTWKDVRDHKALLAAIKKSGVKRLLVAGGSATLYSNGVQRIDLPEFPEPAKPEARSHKVFMGLLYDTKDLDWTFLSPSASGPNFAPGERTGKFRLGGDEFLVDETGKGVISVEDYSVALIDELEHPKHTGRRFTAGY